MGEEEKLLFVRESSGLVKEVGTGFAIMLPIAGCLGPWFQWGGVHISTWNPGATLSVMFTLGTIAIFFEAIADMCLMLAMPRSGAAYYFTGRGLSPLFGVMEGWRSVITNPVFRGVGSFSAFFMLVTGIKIIGYASDSPAVVTAADFWLQPLALITGAIAMVVLGFVFGYLSVKWLGRWYIFNGLMVIISLVIADLIMLATPMTAAVWDATFAGVAANHPPAPAPPLPFDDMSYASIAAAYDVTNWATFNWGAVGPALLLTIGMMWPYLVMPVAGEVSQPSRNLPLSNLGGAAGIGVFFIGSAVSLETCFAGGSSTGFLYAATQALAAQGMTAGWSNWASVCLQGNPISWFLILMPVWASTMDAPGNSLWVSRPFHAMAMDRFCPEAFASVHPKYHVPHISLYFWFIVTIFFTVLSFWINVSVLIGVGYTYMFIRWQMMLAAVALPYHRPTLWERSGAWTFLGIPVISIGGLIFGAFAFWSIIAYVPTLTYEVAFTVGVYVVGQLAYMYYGAKNKAKGIDMAAIFGQLPPE